MSRKRPGPIVSVLYRLSRWFDAIARIAINECDRREHNSMIYTLREENFKMTGEIKVLQDAVAALGTKVGAAEVRVAALEASQSNALNPNDVLAVADSVNSLGARVDALAPAPTSPDQPAAG